jgi:hypothetical protein
MMFSGTLTDENGEGVRLKPGAKVKVTVTSRRGKRRSSQSCGKATFLVGAVS